MYMNFVVLAGFLGKDAAVHNGDNGNFTVLELSTKSSYKDKQSDRYISRTDWHSLIVFGSCGEYAATFKKGDHIMVGGELHHAEYESKKIDSKQQSYTIRVTRLNKLNRSSKTSWCAEEAAEVPVGDEAA